MLRGQGARLQLRAISSKMRARLVQAVSGRLMAETAEARLKRLAMRSWRRGTKEMDLILGPYADAHLAGMGDGRLALYDKLLDENDQDLLPMMLGQMAAPDGMADLVGEISTFANARLLGANLKRNLL